MPNPLPDTAADAFATAMSRSETPDGPRLLLDQSYQAGVRKYSVAQAVIGMVVAGLLGASIGALIVLERLP